MMVDTRYTSALGGAAQGASAGSAFGPWGAAAGGILGGVGGFLSGDEDAEKLAEEQAQLIEKTAEENRRRGMLQLGQIVGTSKARTYASNLIDTGSTRQYRMALESNMRRELAWDMYKSRVEAETVREGGRLASDQMQRSSLSSLITGLPSVAGVFDMFGNTMSDADVDKALGAEQWQF